MTDKAPLRKRDQDATVDVLSDVISELDQENTSLGEIVTRNNNGMWSNIKDPNLIDALVDTRDHQQVAKMKRLGYYFADDVINRLQKRGVVQDITLTDGESGCTIDGKNLKVMVSLRKRVKDRREAEKQKRDKEWLAHGPKSFVPQSGHCKNVPKGAKKPSQINYDE